MQGVCVAIRASRALPAAARSFRPRSLRTTVNCRAASSMAWTPPSGLKYPEPDVVPAINEHKTTMIMIHGLGDTSDGWAQIGYMLGPDLPNTKFIFPTAPIRPITLNGGMRMTGWYDIAELDRINAEQDVGAIKESQQYIEHLVQAEVAAGIPSEKVLVGGFSQGGAVALTMLRSQMRLAGIVGLSCYLLLHHEKPVVSEANKDTPVFMAHGDYDDIVNYAFGRESAELLKAEGVNVDFRTYKYMGHEARQDALADMKDFLQTVLK